MAGYTLQAFRIPAGIVQVSIETDLLGLTVPSRQTFIGLGPRDERIDEDAGVFELETMEFEIFDDASVYNEGFWFKILRSSTLMQIRVMIDEGSGSQDFFYGDLSEEETVWDEKFIGTQRCRTARFKCMNIAHKLFDLNISDLQDEAYALSSLYDVGSSGTNKNFKHVIPAGDFIGCALKAAGLNAGISETYFEFDDSNPDLKFIDGSANEFKVNQLWLPVTYLDMNGIVQKHEYWNTPASGTLDDLYGGDFRSCLGDYLFNFGLYLHVEYDGSEFHGRLFQRHGRAYATDVDMPSPKDSQIQFSSPMGGKGARITNRKYSNQYYWMHDENPSGSASVAPASNLKFDVDRTVLWIAQSVGAGPGYWQTDTFGVGALVNEVVQAVSFKYYDYYLASLVSVGGTIQNDRLQHAICGYNYWKMKVQNQRVTRKYFGIAGTVGALSSFSNLNVLRRTSINDGLNNYDYQASRVTIDPLEHEMELEWVKE